MSVYDQVRTLWVMYKVELESKRFFEHNKDKYLITDLVLVA